MLDNKVKKYLEKVINNINFEEEDDELHYRLALVRRNKEYEGFKFVKNMHYNMKGYYKLVDISDKEKRFEILSEYFEDDVPLVKAGPEIDKLENWYREVL